MYEVVAQSTEGNDVWFAHRLELPNGQQLLNSHVSADAAAFVATLYRETTVGNRRREVTLISIDGNATPPGAIIGDFLADAYSTTYWGGLDDTGHNFVYRLRYSGADYTLEGGNDYSIEFKLATKDYGVIRWSNRLHVNGLNQV